MFRSFKLPILLFLSLAAWILPACQTDGPNPPEVTKETFVETVVVPQGTPEEPTLIAASPTPVPPTPEPAPPRTLAVCLGQEPDTLYPYSGNTTLAAAHIQQAIWDGPIDNRSYTYQPVIIQKIPNLSDGDAVIQRVEATAGDIVIDNDGLLGPLETGVLFRPSGCNSSECALRYDGKSTVLMDQLVVTFQLLPGLRWSDGIPLTAYDSVYSFNLHSDIESEADKFIIERTETYEALDDITLQWIGIPGYMDSKYFTNIWTPLPKHIWGQYTPADLLDAEVSSRLPMGWGPYVIEEWKPGDSIVMRKNENYFRSEEDLPLFDHVIFRFVGEDANSNIAKLISGECDILDQTSRLEDQTSLLLDLNASGEIKAYFTTGTVFEHVDFGIVPVTYDNGWQAGDRPDFFGDVRVRKAIAQCMNRQAVVDNVLFGQSYVLNSYLPPEHPLYATDVVRYPFDVTVGSTLLEEAGWVLGEDGVRVYQGDNPQIPQGTRLSFTYNTMNASHRQKTAEILIASMAQCGIEAVPAYWNTGDFYTPGPDGAIFGRKFDLSQFAWETDVTPPCDLWLSSVIPGGDTDRFPFVWGGWNITGYSNPEFDNVCNAALASLPGQPAYVENHTLAQIIFTEDLPSIPLYPLLKIAASRPDMCEFILDPTANSEMWNIEYFDYGDCAAR